MSRRDTSRTANSPTPPSGRSAEKRSHRHRPGWLAVAFALLAPLVVALEGVFVAMHRSLLARASLVPQTATALIAGASAGLGSMLLLGVAAAWQAARMERGAPGRARLLAGAVAGLVNAVAAAVTVWLVRLADVGGLLEAGLGLVMPPGLRLPFALALAATGLGATVVLGSSISAWFLLPLHLRARIWAVIDTLLLGAVVYALWRLPAQPPPEHPNDLALPITRHVLTTLGVLRLVGRLVPFALDLVERLGFEPLVAARHLRAKKSGFLAAISLLSILAVTVSSCALSTTLSVMGGFRHDLKRKILGNNAHIVVDAEHDTFEDWQPMLKRVRGVEGVQGASPFVRGEVMLSSSSNLSTALLRGVDPHHVGKVLELEDNMRSGKLEYLEHPDKLLELSPMDVSDTFPLKQRGALGPNNPAVPDDDAVPSPGAAGSPPTAAPQADALNAAEAALKGDEPSKRRPPQDVPQPPELEDHREVLPGIVIGRELARTLRLYVGDEVNVVAPLGALGPSGPMPKSRPFRVAGIFYSGMYEYDMKFTYVTLDTAQRFLNEGDAVSGIEIKVDDTDRAPRIAETIRARIDRPDLRVRDWQQLNSRLFGALALEKLAMFITLGIAILVASFCIGGTLTLMVQEKGREVAVLKAMGTSDRGVIRVFMVEGGLIGIFGAALGLFLGYMACFAAENFGIRMNPEVYYIDRLPVHTDPMEFVWVAVASVLVSLLVTVYPALLASRLRPVDALRYE